MTAYKAISAIGRVRVKARGEDSTQVKVARSFLFTKPSVSLLCKPLAKRGTVPW